MSVRLTVNGRFDRSSKQNSLQRLEMGSISIWHLIVAIFIAGPIMGVIRGVKNASILNAVLSVIIPVFGIVYFFAAKRT